MRICDVCCTLLSAPPALPLGFCRAPSLSPNSLDGAAVQPVSSGWREKRGLREWRLLWSSSLSTSDSASPDDIAEPLERGSSTLMQRKVSRGRQRSFQLHGLELCSLSVILPEIGLVDWTLRARFVALVLSHNSRRLLSRSMS